MWRALNATLLVFTLLISGGCGGSGGGGSGGGGSGGGSGGENTPPPASGLSARPNNSSCHAFDYVGSSAVQLTAMTPSLPFYTPVLLLPHPMLTSIVYVLEKSGRVNRVNLTNSTRSTMVDMGAEYNLSSCGECGLLGMAFDPDFSSNGAVYFSFTEDRGGAMHSIVARFVSNDNGLTLQRDVSSNLLRSDLLDVVQPYENHNGGHIAFGPDDLLYIGLGDGGSGSDPDNNGQTISTLLGAMLRLNSDGTPAAGNNVPGALPEIYAYGLRNPWRFSFDRVSGALWLGDVGQNAYEEIDIIENGGNYGWRCYEGMHRTNNSCTSSGPYIDPVVEYDHSEGVSVTGGYVYRGSTIPALWGAYLFADFGSGTVWALFDEGGGNYRRETLLETGHNISSFGEDAAGELYLVTFSGIFRISPAPDPDSGPPALLSQTGCVLANAPQQAAEGLIPYSIIEPFWSDGASKTRFLALPNGERIDVDASGDFQFPAGSVLMKHFFLDQRLIETRLFMRRAAGNWVGHSYQWNEAGTDATLVTNALDEAIGGQLWHFPSSGECAQCHTAAAGFSLGLETAQLNTAFTYPQTGITANQLDTFTAIGLFSAPLTSTQTASTLADSTNAAAALETRARSWLHSNCSNCHRPGGTSQSTMDWRFTTSLGNTVSCNREPLNGDLGITGARLLLPGDADSSLLYRRLIDEGSNRMPPLGSHVIDEQGAQLIRSWIESLDSCS